MQALRVDAVKLGDVDLLPKYAAVSLADSGDLIAAVTSKKIVVLAMSLRLATSNTIKFQSGASTNLTGVMTATSLDLPYCPVGWLRTATGEKLNAVLGSAVQLSGWIVYVEV